MLHFTEHAHTHKEKNTGNNKVWGNRGWILQMVAKGGKMRLIKERGIYMWQTNHLRSVSELILEGRERPKWKLSREKMG